MKTYRIQEYKDSKKTIDTYMKNKKDYGIIHYACQSFYEDNCQNSPRITAISIMFPHNREIHVFSLASVAEQKSIDLNTADCETLNTLEKEALQEFYNFIKGLKRTVTWIHWNMKDQNYGFSALARRYCKLHPRKKAPFDFDEDKKINLSTLLSQRYGDKYASHPRQQNLLEKNHIKPKNLLTGREEAEAFKQKQYLAIERSVQAKVQAFSEILDRMANNELITDGDTLSDIYGISFMSFLTYLKENPVFSSILVIIGGLFTNFLYDIIKSFLIK